MGISDELVKELRQETAATRRVLERVPEEQLGWKPHERSMSLGQLALHLAGLPGGLAEVLDAPEREVPVVPLPEAASVSEVLGTLEQSSAEAECRLLAWGEEGLQEPFRWTVNGQAVHESTRYSEARSTLFNHWIHHRGQMTVYLRLLDVPLPFLYGPTADEG